MRVSVTHLVFHECKIGQQLAENPNESLVFLPPLINISREHSPYYDDHQQQLSYIEHKGYYVVRNEDVDYPNDKVQTEEGVVQFIVAVSAAHKGNEPVSPRIHISVRDPFCITSLFNDLFENTFLIIICRLVIFRSGFL